MSIGQVAVALLGRIMFVTFHVKDGQIAVVDLLLSNHETDLLVGSSFDERKFFNQHFIQATFDLCIDKSILTYFSSIF